MIDANERRCIFGKQLCQPLRKTAAAPILSRPASGGTSDAGIVRLAV
jgi:hypothetical protein